MSDEALINSQSQALFQQRFAELAGDELAGDDDYGKFDLLGLFKKSPGTESYSDKPTLRQGSSDSANVKELQKLLGVPQTGVFTQQLEIQVREFQRQNGLTPFGVVDTDTWAVLYGNKKAVRKEKTAKTVADIASFGTGLFSQFTSQQGGAEMPIVVQQEEDPGPNYLLWIGVPVALLLVGGGIYYMTRDSDQE